MKTICKKFLASLLVCCIMLGLAACGGSGSSAATTSAPEAAALSRYDYTVDMQGNTVEFTIAQNLKSVQISIPAMGLDLTAMCKIENNILTLTELAEGNEQFYKGLSANSYELNEDGTTTVVVAQ